MPVDYMPFMPIDALLSTACRLHLPVTVFSELSLPNDYSSPLLLVSCLFSVRSSSKARHRSGPSEAVMTEGQSQHCHAQVGKYEALG
eukprot:6418009-Amphidinium_carterae.1